jgi:hypothetical protein
LVAYNLYAIEAATGERRWAFRTEYAVASRPAAADGTVYVGSKGNRFYAVDTRTGSAHWQFRASDSIESSPALANGLVYFGSNDGKIYALDMYAIAGMRNTGRRNAERRLRARARLQPRHTKTHSHDLYLKSRGTSRVHRRYTRGRRRARPGSPRHGASAPGDQSPGMATGHRPPASGTTGRGGPRNGEPGARTAAHVQVASRGSRIVRSAPRDRRERQGQRG